MSTDWALPAPFGGYVDGSFAEAFGIFTPAGVRILEHPPTPADAPYAGLRRLVRDERNHRYADDTSYPRRLEEVK